MNARRSPLPDAAKHPDLDRVLRDLPAAEAEGLREVWDAAALATPEEVSDAEAVTRTERLLTALAALDADGASPGRDRHADRPPVRGHRTARQRLLAWSTPFALAAVLALVWLGRPVAYEAAPGERLDVRLPDGSTVTLNSGTTLRRSRLFDSPFAARTVRLEGEAFFDVVKDETPFVVRTFDARVTVLGTEFGVRAWTDEPEAATTVALVSGRVRLAPDVHPEAATILSPGDVRSVEGGGNAAGTESTADALAWRHGDLVYKDRPLGVVLQDVERRFGVVLTPQPRALGDQRVSVALRAPASAEAVVRDLASAFGLRYRARGDGFELYKPPPAAPPNR